MTDVNIILSQSLKINILQPTKILQSTQTGWSRLIDQTLLLNNRKKDTYRLLAISDYTDKIISIDEFDKLRE